MRVMPMMRSTIETCRYAKAAVLIQIQEGFKDRVQAVALIEVPVDGSERLCQPIAEHPRLVRVALEDFGGHLDPRSVHVGDDAVPQAKLLDRGFHRLEP